MTNPLKLVTVTILSGAATSTAFDLFGYKVVGVLKAATWTAADISFEIDPLNSGTFVKVIDNAGALVKITGVSTTVAEYYVPPEIGDTITGERAKIVSTNTASEVDVNQAQDVILTAVLAPLSG